MRSKSWRFTGVGLLVAVALSAGCGSSGGGTVDSGSLTGRGVSGLASGPGSAVDSGENLGNGGPRNPGPGTGVPVSFNPGEPAATPTPSSTPLPTPPAGGGVGQRYFVTARNGEEVGVFNATTFAREGTVDLNDRAAGAALDSVRGTLYVTLTNSGDVAVLDTSNLSLPPTVFPSGGVGGIGPLDIVYDTDRVFVTNHTSSTVRGVDVGLVPFGTGSVPQATEVAVDNVRNRVYVTSNTFNPSSQSRLFIFDQTLGNTPTVVVTSVDGDETADGLAYDSLGGAIYVGNDGGAGGQDHFVVLDADNPTLPVPILAPGSRITSIAVDNDHNRLYVCCFGSNLVAVYDTSGGALNPVPLPGSETIATGSGPIHVTYEPGRERLLVVNQNSNNVSVFDVSSGVPQAVTGSPFTVGGLPYVIVPDITQTGP